MTPGSQTHSRTGILGRNGVERRMILGAVMIGTLVLSGCAPEATVDPVPSETPTVPVTEPSETPTAPEPAADVLFTVTATVRATDGTAIEISLVAHEPRSWDDPRMADLADEFLSRCADGNGLTPIDEGYLAANGTTLMKVDFESNTPDFQFESPIQLYFGNVFFPRAAFTDAVVSAGGDANCYAGATWLFTNDAYGIASFETGSTTPDPRQWQFGSYGFQLLPDARSTVESCVKVITELGAASGVESVSGWDVTRADGPTACGIGYIEPHNHDD